MNELYNQVKKRGIKHLFHFTSCSNLKSICKYGLVSRERVEDIVFAYDYNDDIRYDGLLNTVSTSISFPNYKMFYWLRKNNPEKDWAVIVIDSSVLYEQDCLFCITNAASTEVTSQSVDERRGIRAFNNLFYDESFRIKMKMPNNLPTNPQAEVLVFDNIKVDKIQCILFEDKITMNKYKDVISEFIEIEVEPDAFRPRFDYEHWSDCYG